MRILIVDDDTQKGGEIKNVFRNTAELKEVEIDFVVSINDAREKLRTLLYDLLILDLHIPDELGGIPKSDIGISFIDEICNSELYYIPMDIVALTAFKEAKSAFSSNPDLSGFTILQYDTSENNWREFLISRAIYLLNCNKQRRISKRLYESDVLWITTVDVEADAVRRLYKWKEYQVENDASRYEVTEQACGDKGIRIVHVQLPEMGIAASAAITTKAILHFSPRYIIMTGIAAGLEDSLKPAEVMISDFVWNYDSGKWEEEQGEDGNVHPKWKPDGKTKDIPFALAEKLKTFSKKEKEFANNLVGTYACGSAVVASDQKVKDDIKSHFRKTIAIDMESYGVLLAAETTTYPAIPAIIIKGKSDKGDKDKDDSMQKRAAEGSAKVAKDLVEFLFSECD